MSKNEEAIFLQHGQPLVFGNNAEKGILLDGLTPRVVRIGEDGISAADLWQKFWRGLGRGRFSRLEDIVPK